MDHACKDEQPQGQIDCGEAKLILTDLVYFIDEGLAKLLRAMLRQSLKDILQHRSDPHAPAEISASARWPRSEDGIRSIEFLMPTISSERVVARIYSDTAQMLEAFENAEFERTTKPDAGHDESRTYGIVLPDDFDEPGRPFDDEEDVYSQPLGASR